MAITAQHWKARVLQMAVPTLPCQKPAELLATVLHALTVATRNADVFAGAGVRLLNPFSAA